MKFKTPEELAREEKGKEAVSLYLDKKSLKYIRERAAKVNIPVSQIVNEAITYYINAIKDRKSE